MNNKITLAAVAIAIAGSAFYGGMKYDQSANTSSFATRRTGGGAGLFSGARTRNGAQSGGFTSGQIIGLDSQSATVKIADGSSKIIFFSASTKIMKSVDGTSADLANGKDVSVTGTANPDGSITAQSIQLRTAMPQTAQQ